MARVCRWQSMKTEVAEATLVLGEAKMMMEEADGVNGGRGVRDDGLGRRRTCSWRGLGSIEQKGAPGLWCLRPMGKGRHRRDG